MFPCVNCRKSATGIVAYTIHFKTCFMGCEV
jgi:hypothetical protein